MDNSQKEEVKSPTKDTTPGTVWTTVLWMKELLFPVLVTIIGFFLVHYASKFIESKTGELLIQSNVDSAEVFLNGELKGITQPVDTLNNMYKLEIHSVYPGSYQLVLKKKHFNDIFITDVVVNPGYLTSKDGRFDSPRKSSAKEIPINAGSINKDTGRKLPEVKNERPGTVEPAVPSTKPIVRRLTIWISQEIPLAKVSLYVNSSLMGAPSSHEFSIELPVGLNEITITYRDAIGQYRYSTTRNISGNDTLIVKQNEFEPN